MAFMFEKLAVYQKAVDFADQVTALSGVRCQYPKVMRLCNARAAAPHQAGISH